MTQVATAKMEAEQAPRPSSRARVLVGRDAKGQVVDLDLRYVNRHGMITGATGSGKTTTMRLLAEGFSRNGVPVLIVDIKDELSGLALRSDDVLWVSRAQRLSYDPKPTGFPTRTWDPMGKVGFPIRIPISEFSPTAMAKMLGLSAVQEGVVAIAFKHAEENDLPLTTIDDFREVLTKISGITKYGTAASSSVGAIQRGLLRLEENGADAMIGGPLTDATLAQYLITISDGRGVINRIKADEICQNTGRAYAALLMWILETCRRLPEVGDTDKPKLVLMLDEAHVMFDEWYGQLADSLERSIRLVRSKGVGVFLCTQSPADVPDSISRQVANRIHHRANAYSAKEQRAVRTIVDTIPGADDAPDDVLGTLGIGQALCSFMGEGGAPSQARVVEVFPPSSSSKRLPIAAAATVRLRIKPTAEDASRVVSPDDGEETKENDVPLWLSRSMSRMERTVGSTKTSAPPRPSISRLVAEGVSKGVGLAVGSAIVIAWTALFLYAAIILIDLVLR